MGKIDGFVENRLTLCRQSDITPVFDPARGVDSLDQLIRDFSPHIHPIVIHKLSTYLTEPEQIYFI